MAGSNNFSGMDFSSSSYHPSWESREFDKKQYKEELEKLNSKDQNKWLIVENQSFKSVTLIGYIFSTIKGWFYSETQTDPIKVNYQLLKFLRYGQTHHFLADNDIKNLVLNLQKTLAQEKQEAPFKNTSALIAKIAARSIPIESATNQLEAEITKYYKDYKEQLIAPGFFHSTNAPIIPNTAGIHYNMGRIHASEGRHEAAIVSFEAALKMTPEKPEWQLALVKSAYDQGKQLIREGKLLEALPFFDKGLDLSKQIISKEIMDGAKKADANAVANGPHFDNNRLFTLQANQSILTANFFKLYLNLKLDRFSDVNQILESEFDDRDFIEWYTPPIQLVGFEAELTPSDTQQGEFLLLLADKMKKTGKKTYNPNKSIEYTKAGIAALTRAGNSNAFTPHITHLLLHAHFYLLESTPASALEGNLIEFKSNLLQCLHYFNVAKNQFSNKAEADKFAKKLLPYLSDAIDNCVKQNDVENGITFCKAKKEFLEMPADRAHVVWSLYSFYKMAGDNTAALDELKQGVPISPSFFEQQFLSLADKELKSKNYALLIDYLRDYHAVRSDSQAILNILAEAYNLYADECIKAGNKTLALKILTNAPALTPLFPVINKKINELHTEFADAEIKANNLDKALEHLLAVNGRDINILSKLVHIHYTKKNWVEASTFISALLPLQPNYENYLRAAIIFDKLGRKNDAIPHAKKAKSLAPKDDSTASVLLFDLEGKTDHSDLPEAIATCLAILKLRPNDQKALLELARHYIQSKRKNEAIPHLKHLIALKKDNFTPYSMLGKILTENGNYEEALQLYNEAAKLFGNKKFNEDICLCYKGLMASALEKNNPAGFLELAKQALSATKEIAQRRSIALDLIQAGDGMFKDNPRMALLLYRSAMPELTPKLDDEQLIGIYQKFAAEARENRQFDNEVLNLEEAFRLDKNNITIRKDLAGAYISVNRFQQAEQIYDDLIKLDPKNAPNYRQNLIDLFAKTKDSEKLIATHQNGLANASPEQKLHHAASLAVLATNIYKTDPEKALQIFLSIEAYLDKLDNKKYQRELVTAYIAIGQSFSKNEPKKAREYYTKAQINDPNFTQWNASWLFEAADLFKRSGNLSTASEIYRIGFELNKFQPDVKISPLSLSNFSATENEIGNKYFERNLFDLKLIQQSLVALADYATKGPKANEITVAFGANRNLPLGLGALASIFSDDTKLFKKLSDQVRTASTPEAIERAGAEFCAHLEKAYDGGPNHYPKKDQPPELTALIETVRSQISNMQDYYMTLHIKAKEVIKQARLSDYGAPFENSNRFIFTDLSKAAALKESANDVLNAFNQAAKAKDAPKITSKLQESVNALRQVLTPQVWNYLAIDHYKRVVELSNQYGQYCNNLIEAFVRVGDYATAVAIFEQFVSKFPPHTPLSIDPRAYPELAKTKAVHSQETRQRIFSGLILSAEVHEKRQEFDQAVTVYKQAFEFSENQSLKIAGKLINLGHHLMHINDHKTAYEAYMAGFPYLEKLKLDPMQKASLYQNLGFISRELKKFSEAEDYFLKSLTLQENHKLPKNAMTLFWLAGTYEAQQNFDQALEYYNRALEVEPNNNTFKQKIHATVMNLGDQTYALAVAEINRQNLDKLVEETRNKFMNLDKHLERSMYSAKIVKALSSFGRGSWSADNRNLKRYLTNPSKDAAILADEGTKALALIDKAFPTSNDHKNPPKPNDLNIIMQVLQEQINTINRDIKNLKTAPVQKGKPQTDKQLLALTTNHYKRAQQMNPIYYGDYCNKWIDAYVKQGNYEAAIASFEAFQLKFKNEAPNLTIDPKAYLNILMGHLKGNRLVDAVKFAKDSIAIIEQYPNQEHLVNELRKGLSHAYVIAGKEKIKGKFLTEALKWFTKAQNCGIPPTAECLAAMGELYSIANENKISLDDQPFVDNDKPQDFTKQNPYKLEAIQYYYKAVQAEPTNAVYQAKLGEILTDMPRGITLTIEKNAPYRDPVPYVRTAAVLDPTNADYALLIHKAIKYMISKKANAAFGVSYDENHLKNARDHYLALGGKINLPAAV